MSPREHGSGRVAKCSDKGPHIEVKKRGRTGVGGGVRRKIEMEGRIAKKDIKDKKDPFFSEKKCRLTGVGEKKEANCLFL